MKKLQEINLKEYLTHYYNFSETTFKNKFPEIYKKIIQLTCFLPENSKFSIRKYIILKNFSENDLKCPVCGKFKKFVFRPYMKFLDTCGDKKCQMKLCSNTNKKIWKNNYNLMYKKCCESLINLNKNLTEEQKQIRSKKISTGIRSLSPEEEKERIRKGFETRKERNRFNKSIQENNVFKKLLTKFADVERQYFNELYPWHVDFYIPSLNLYIEYQGSWIHGKKPFENNEECIKILNEWNKKSLHSNFYKCAIKVWTITDVMKRNHAKNNNLNWVEFFNEAEFDEWLKLQ